MNYKQLLLVLTCSLSGLLASHAQDEGLGSFSLNANSGPTIPQSITLTNTITTSVSSTGAGTAAGGGSKATGKSFTLTAAPSATLKDVFLDWTINGVIVFMKTPYTFTPTASETVVANFGYNITTFSSPAAGGTNTGAGLYPIGQSVTVIATPGDCYDFLGWTITGQKTYLSTSPTYTFTPAKSEALIANYQLKEDVITTASNPIGAGTTTGGGTKACDSPVTVSAKAGPGYKFTAWKANGIVASINNPYAFKADGAETLTANFVDNSTPTLLITSPKASETVSSPFLTITGTANNILGVSSVVLTVGGVPATVTSGNNWSNWTASVTLSPGHNLISAYAFSENNNPSKTDSITVTYSSAGNAPASIAGLLVQVDQGTNAPFDVSFGSATFEQVSAGTNQGSSVGNYTYTQTGANTATLVLANFTPPGSSGGQGPSIISLTFTSPTAGSFIDQSGHTGTLSLSPGSSQDFSSVSGWTIVQSTGAASPTNITFFGDNIYTNIDAGGNTNYGTYTSMQYGPMATMVVLTNLSLTSGVETNYLMFFWTTADAGTIYETFFDSAGDPPTYSSSPFTGTFQASGIKYFAPASLNGMNFIVTQKTPQSEPAFSISFGEATEAQLSTSTNNKARISNYVYTRTGQNSAILNASEYLPSTGSDNSGAIYLQFTSPTTANYQNPSDPSSGSIAVSVVPATGYFAPTSLTHATITVHFPSGTHAATFNDGNFAINGSSKSGTYTFSAYSPTVAMLIFNFTDAADAGEIEYIQLQFTSATGGNIYETETDGSRELGTFSVAP